VEKIQIAMIDILKKRLREESQIVLNVKVRAGAQNTKWREQMDDGTYKVDVAAAPEGGKANEELIRFLADEFEVGRSNIEIVSGQTSKIKTLKIIL
jgi:uncharacterized protein (TIGR00251 family)